jgi:hypothetical protein
METKDRFKEAIGKIADGINNKRRQELVAAYTKKDAIKDYLRSAKMARTYKHGYGKAHWRKIASMPQCVDDFFTALYGPEYYKEPDFFKHYPEWATLNPSDQ